jgi:hypothetical protein
MSIASGAERTRRGVFAGPLKRCATLRAKVWKVAAAIIAGLGVAVALSVRPTDPAFKATASAGPADMEARLEQEFRSAAG